MSSKKEIFISVDVETAGPIPGEYSLLTIGACQVDKPDKTFTCELKPITLNADPKALEVTGLSLTRLQLEGLEPQQAMREFNQWLQSLTDTESDIVFVGFNAPFDWSFINYYFHRYLGENPFGFAALDIKSMYMGATNSTWRQTRSSEITKHLQPTLAGDHDALHDAQYQAELFRLIQAYEKTSN